MSHLHLSLIITILCTLNKGWHGGDNTPFLVNSKIIQESWCDPNINKEGCQYDTLAFNRVNLKNDPNKHISIKMYGISKEAVLMNVMILHRMDTYVFNQLYGESSRLHHNHSLHSNHTMGEGGGSNSILNMAEYMQKYNTYHPGLMIDFRSMSKYKKITRDSTYLYNQEIGIISKSVKFVMPYRFITFSDSWRIHTQTKGGPVPIHHYNALLSLDRSSSIWDNFNILSIDRHEVRLSYHPKGKINSNVEDFDGITRMKCYRHEIGQCLVVKRGQLVISGKHYPKYRLFIDFNSQTNYLPSNLYFKWFYTNITEERHFHVHLKDYKRDVTGSIQTESEEEDDEEENGDESFNITTLLLNSNNILHLNGAFTYEVNEHSNDIIIGISLLHVFPRFEYSHYNHHIHLWHHSGHYHYETYEGISIFFAIMAPFNLLCMGFWFMSNHYRIYHFLILYPPLTQFYFYFSYLIVHIEMFMLLLSLIVNILSLVYHNATPSLVFQYYHSNHYKRVLLLTSISWFNMIVLFVILACNTTQIKRAILIYFRIDIDAIVLWTRLKWYKRREDRKKRSDLKKQQQQRPAFQPTVTSQSSPQPLPQYQHRLTLPTRRLTSPNRQNLSHGNEQVMDSGTDNDNMDREVTVDDLLYPITVEGIDGKGDLDYQIVKGEYLTNEYPTLDKIPTSVLIIRNFSLWLLIFTNLLLLLNFATENNHVYRLWFVITSFMLVFFYTYYIYISLIFITLHTARILYRKFGLFILYFLAQIASFIIFIVLSFHCIYLGYFRSVNSIYSDTLIYAFVVGLMAMLIMVAVIMISYRLDYYLNKYYLI